MTDDLYQQDQTFDHIDFTQSALQKGEYEFCRFLHCNFTSADLSAFKFTDCQFTGCNLSLVILHQTSLRDIQFKDCKMMGIRFELCNEFGLSFSFEGCQLNHSSFFKTKIKKTVFRSSDLQETDFSGCDLTGALFDKCNLARAVFENTHLEKTDFRTAYHFTFDPEKNRVKKARFSIWGLSGLLAKYDLDIEK